ncbi:hypothetical protein I302_108732 [Kwoniella bestiolae CBS 10118]|uniref:Uncharacterized protein n=1 Tax=Kwoniella bestiolae CBS 10118 TaxID=1296100 RepID=A0A1B9FTX6_9TREE|nr:hypothetical protein I302_07869 [Kwoniella bestiolae CBS 10118]OCF22224.1 hypothetical protein I302_07869 [Kwoniella bestiolae CBS 10118]
MSSLDLDSIRSLCLLVSYQLTEEIKSSIAKMGDEDPDYSVDSKQASAILNGRMLRKLTSPTPEGLYVIDLDRDQRSLESLKDGLK